MKQCPDPVEALDIEHCLKTVQPLIASYGWMIALLRLAAKRHGLVPARVYRFLKRFANPKRPYFIGKTHTGVTFVGDIFDEYSISWAVRPAFEEKILNMLQKTMRQREGVFVDVGANG